MKLSLCCALLTTAALVAPTGAQTAPATAPANPAAPAPKKAEPAKPRAATKAAVPDAKSLPPKAAAVVPQPQPSLKPVNPPPATPVAGAAPRTVTWEQLLPPNWDPFKEFKNLDLQSLNDGDPRANEVLAELRRAWDRAPVNPQLVGQAVRIPGFVVPLEENKSGLTEFLLVPYFGACVHSPPPPANQIIHVLPKTAAAGFRSMDTVWITGTLSQAQTETYMGAASWRIEGAGVAPYVEAPTR